MRTREALGSSRFPLCHLSRHSSLLYSTVSEHLFFCPDAFPVKAHSVLLNWSKQQSVENLHCRSFRFSIKEQGGGEEEALSHGTLNHGAVPRTGRMGKSPASSLPSSSGAQHTGELTYVTHCSGERCSNLPLSLIYQQRVAVGGGILMPP